MDFLLSLLEYVPTVLAVLGALSLCVATIAKLTPTDKDDKLAAGLTYLHDLLAKLVPGQASLVEKKAGAAVVKAGASVVLRR